MGLPGCDEPGGKEQSPHPWRGCICGSRRSSASSAWSGWCSGTGRRRLEGKPPQVRGCQETSSLFNIALGFAVVGGLALGLARCHLGDNKVHTGCSAVSGLAFASSLGRLDGGRAAEFGFWDLVPVTNLKGLVTRSSSDMVNACLMLSRANWSGWWCCYCQSAGVGKVWHPSNDCGWVAPVPSVTWDSVRA